MLDSVFSPIDWTLRNFGLLDGNLFWLGRPNLAMISVIAVHVWRITPLAAVIVMAGMMAIRATSRRRPRRRRRVLAPDVRGVGSADIAGDGRAVRGDSRSPT